MQRREEQIRPHLVKGRRSFFIEELAAAVGRPMTITEAITLLLHSYGSAGRVLIRRVMDTGVMFSPLEPSAKHNKRGEHGHITVSHDRSTITARGPGEWEASKR